MATLILVLCLLNISSAIGGIDLCIIGGNKTQIENFPFHVSIKEAGTNNHVAGGAVITEKFVITAAHCITLVPDLVTNYYIFVGSTELSNKGQTHDIEDAISHPHYNTNKKIHDIGIIAIKGKFTFSNLVKPIRILMKNVPAGTYVTISGWGYTSYPNGNYSLTLQKLETPVISQRKCKKTLIEADDINLKDTQFCTYKKIHKGTCLGDSGGPVTLAGMLVGVISCGKACAVGKPDIHTKVSKYVHWIKSTINKYCKTRTCPRNNLYPQFVRRKLNNLLYYRG